MINFDMDANLATKYLNYDIDETDKKRINTALDKPASTLEALCGENSKNSNFTREQIILITNRIFLRCFSKRSDIVDSISKFTLSKKDKSKMVKIIILAAANTPEIDIAKYLEKLTKHLKKEDIKDILSAGSNDFILKNGLGLIGSIANKKKFLGTILNDSYVEDVSFPEDKKIVLRQVKVILEERVKINLENDLNRW